MKTRFFLKLMASITALLVLALPAVAQGQQPNRVDVLIGFVSPPIPEDVAVVQAVGGQVRYVYSIVPAMAASVPEPALRGLARDRRVRYIEEDAVAFALQQSVPWGIDRVFGDEIYSFTTWTATRGAGVGVAILDTGIDPNHQDLTVLGGRRFYQQGPFLRSDNDYSDGHGHGTHVAGTVAALDNTVGVVGVGPAAGLYAVKVLDNSGRGSASTVVAGIDWAVQQNIPILNMSLGFGSHVQTVQEACDNAYAANHLVVAAAGNSGNSGGTGDNVGYPAAYASVIAVAASDSNDQRASWSSTGAAVELIAPGVGVLSTLPNNNYGTYSGTSMASPHVAGVAALVWAADAGLNNVQVRTILQDTAQNLGLDANHQGHGLVRADLAVREVVNVGSPKTFTITANADEGGTISPSGAVTVNEGADQSFSITPSAGYQIAAVVVDGISVGAVSSYTFDNVAQNHSIDATFSTVPTHTINASTGAGGTISPSGAVTVNEGADQSFSITPSAGYQIADVMVDDTSVGAISSYTFSNVTDDHTIHASFALVEVVGLSIDKLDLTNTSNPAWAKVLVDWQVSGTSLSSVTLDVTFGNGATQTQTISVGGSQASGSSEFREREGSGTVSVTLTVTDTNGGSMEEKKGITL